MVNFHAAKRFVLVRTALRYARVIIPREKSREQILFAVSIRELFDVINPLRRGHFFVAVRLSEVDVFEIANEKLSKTCSVSLDASGISGI